MQRAHHVRLPHGQHIYAYSHVRTNQVLYSLSQTLRSAQLRQLPDLGANNTDSQLRKDLWRPLYTVCLPPGRDGQKQGLSAYRKLREWRRLHEQCWEPPALLTQPFRASDIQKLKERLDERGGSKKESPHDLIRRIKKKERVRVVQNQKANSIADLAAVLLSQDELGAQTADRLPDMGAEDRQREIAEFIRLAEQAESGRLADLEGRIADLHARLARVLARSDREGKGSDEPMSRKKLERAIRALTQRKREIEFAANAVQNAKDPVRAQQQRQRADKARREKKWGLRLRQARGGELEKIGEDVAQIQRSLEEAAAAGEAQDGPEFVRLEQKLYSDLVRQKELELVLEAAASPHFNGELGEATKGLTEKAFEYRIQLLSEALVKADAEGNTERAGRLRNGMEGVERSRDEWMRQQEEQPGAGETTASERATGSQQVAIHKGSDSFLEKAKARRAHQLITLAAEATDGGLGRLDAKIAESIAWLEQNAGRGLAEEKRTRGSLSGLRMKRNQMALAAEAAKENPTTDMLAEEDTIRLQMFEYRAQLAREELEDAVRKDGANADRLQTLREAFARAERNRDELRETGVLAEERERATRASAKAAQRAGSRKAAEASTAATIDSDWTSRLPSFPVRLLQSLPKRSPLKLNFKNHHRPVFTTEGVIVKWNNILDAEYAEAWPANVTHERMGWSRHNNAPKPFEEATNDVGEWKARQWSNRDANWLQPAEEDAEALEKEANEFEQRQVYVEGIKDSILSRLRAKEEEEKRRQNETMDSVGREGQKETPPLSA